MAYTNLQGKTVLITGATAGIGQAAARLFAQHGARLILTGRRTERLAELEHELQEQHRAQVLPLTLDVRNRELVEEVLGNLPPEWRQVDVLINNAGLARGRASLEEGDVQDWEEMLDTNVKGLLYVSRTLARGMVQRGRGHIIHLGSVAGVDTYADGTVYCASKSAVHTLAEGMRLDLYKKGVRVSLVAPGLVETEFSLVRYHGDSSRASVVYEGYTPLTAADVADVLAYVAAAPPHVNLAEVLVLPTDQANSSNVNKRQQINEKGHG